MKTELKTIEEELNDCKAAWGASPDAKFAWTCHHSLLFEPLLEPWINRVNYILKEKAEDQRAARLRNFRPVRVELPESLVKACREWDKARSEWDKACREWDKARSEWDEAWQERDKAWQEYYKASREWYKVLAVTDFNPFHDQDWPDHTWNGKDIFEQNENTTDI